MDMAELHRVLGRIEGKLDKALELEKQVKDLQSFRTRTKATATGAGMMVSTLAAVVAFYGRVKGLI